MEFKNRTFLVCGGMGFLGSSIANKLLAKGAKVTATYHTKKPAYFHENLSWIEADLTDQNTCLSITKGIDYVFMCAANTAGAAVIVNSPLSQVTPNVIMNTYTLEAAYTNKVKKFVFISSGAAYPDLGTKPLVEEDMFVASPPPVYYAVGWMKRYTEILCQTYAEKISNPMATLVIRPSNVYGPGDKFDPQKSHVTAALIRKVIDRLNPFSVWGTGEDVRDLIYIEDFLEGAFTAFAHPVPFMAVNISSGKGYTIKEILNTALQADNYHDAVVSYDPTKPQTIGYRIIDPTFAKDTLGFEAKTSLEDGIKKTISWYKQNFLASTAS
jgi:GDP-L-fucose synthase